MTRLIPLSLALACVTLAETRPPAPGRVVPTAPMTARRATHSATLLPGGKVLIAGGFGTGEAALASAELYDPALERFSPTAPMGAARSGHSAIRLPNGEVLITGGYDGSYLKSAELYDPAGGVFRPTGNMTTARSGHVAVLLRSGKVLLAGGVGTGWTFLDSAELYDPATGTFAPTGSMTVARESHTANLLPDGSVLIVGGADERDERGTYRSAERYDPVTGRFSDAGTMHAARYKLNGSSVLLSDGTVLLLGGATVSEIYDPVRRIFSVIPEGVGATRLFAATSVLPGGSVLLTGGYGEGVSAGREAWVYRR